MFQVFEPEAPALQGRCSIAHELVSKLTTKHQAELQAHYEYERLFDKKEVIQPQVPLRLPCDDLTLLAELRFDLIKN